MSNWYVYQHLTLDTNRVFYVGIGCQPNFKRAYYKSKRSKYWANIVNKHGLKVEILYQNKSKEDVIKIERELILLYGRSDLLKGSLCNLTDGGDGVCNLTEEGRNKISNAVRGRKHTDEVKKIISESGKGRKHNEESKKLMSENRKGKVMSKEKYKLLGDKLRGRKLSEETKKKMTESLKGRILSDETKRKIGKTKIGNKYMLGKKLSDEAKHKIRLSKLGNNSPSKKWDEATRQNVSKLTKERLKLNHPFKGKTHTQESKNKMSESAKGKRCGELNPFFGKTHSPEVIAKILETRRKNKLLKKTIKQQNEEAELIKVTTF